MPKALPDAAKKETDNDEIVMAVVVDGVTYSLRPMDLQPTDFRQYKRQTGGNSLMSDLNAIGSDADPSSLVALLWAARRQAGDPQPIAVIDQQVGSLGELAELEIEIVDDEVDDEDDLDPES